MKHILNNLSEQEKNAIREQHTGGMNVVTENFHKLLGSKLGDSKPLTEQTSMIGKAASAITGQGKPSTQKTVGSPMQGKPIAMSGKVKQLVGYLKSNGYTSSEIYQAQQYIKNAPVAPVQQKSTTPAKPTGAVPSKPVTPKPQAPTDTYNAPEGGM